MTKDDHDLLIAFLPIGLTRFENHLFRDLAYQMQRLIKIHREHSITDQPEDTTIAEPQTKPQAVNHR